MGQLWENYGKTMGKLWENYRKTIPDGSVCICMYGVYECCGVPFTIKKYTPVMCPHQSTIHTDPMGMGKLCGEMMENYGKTSKKNPQGLKHDVPPLNMP